MGLFKKNKKGIKKTSKKVVSMFLVLAMTIPSIFPEDVEGANSENEVKLINSSEFKIVDENISKLHSTKSPATVLFDNQNLVPLHGGEKGKQISGKNWKQTYNNSWGITSCYIDLGAEYCLDNLGYMDTNGVQTWEIFYGTPFEWKSAGTFITNTYLNWRYKNLYGIKTRYIRLVTTGGDTGVNELALYGYKIANVKTSDTKLPQATKELQLTSGQKIGACGFCDDPYTALSALGNLRDYYNWSWVSGDKESKLFDFNRIVNRDKFYTNLKNMNILAIPCVQGTSYQFLDNGEKWDDIKNTKPVEKGANTLDPTSYATHSNFMYNMSARYGANKLPESTLNTSDKVSGLNTLKAVESWNEQNKDWESIDSYFSPYEYAAMLSADWDGHEGEIKNGGVKTANKDMLLAMGGTVGSGTRVIDYLDLMKHWFEFNRSDKEFCADIINVHSYITDSEAPEKSSFRSDIRALNSWIDANIPGRDLWISEFDVLTSDKEIKGVNNHDNLEYAKARADRLLRAFLIADREGVDISSMFMLRDEWSGVYSNSGLTTGKGQWDKKDSWYYISCASDVLKNADLISVKETDDVYIYTYKDRNTSEKIIAVWSPTADGSTIKDYKINTGNYNKAILVTPTNGIKEGNKSGLIIKNGSVTVNVSETPLFIKASDDDVALDNYPQSIINVVNMRLGSHHGSVNTVMYDNKKVINLAKANEFKEVTDELHPDYILSQFYHLFDEQSKKTTNQTPWTNVKNSPMTTWQAQQTAIINRQSFPYDCVLTFDDYYDLTYIGFYDTYGTGKFEIYNNETNELIYSYNLDSYMNWNMCPIVSGGKKVNSIRILKYDSAKLNEMAFYGYKTYSKVGNDTPSNQGMLGEEDISLHRKSVVSVENGKLTLSKLTNQKDLDLVKSNFWNLFDEQELAPIDDQHTISEKNPFKTKFGNIWRKTFPLDCIVNFGSAERINKVGIMNEWGSANGTILIKDLNGNILKKCNITAKNKWFYFDLNESITTKKIVVEKSDTVTLSQIAFY